MNCLNCGYVSDLIRSWSLEGTIKRFRKCSKCGHKFFTYEVPEDELKGTTFGEVFFDD